MLTVFVALPMLFVSATPPIEWRCYPDLYGDGQSCDCGCGIVDPDCRFEGGEVLQDFAACDNNFCSAGTVPLQGAPGACVAGLCGDGFVGKGENCDDGDGPGCDDTCQLITEGYRCSGLGAGCGVPRCGDGAIDGKQGERCDDGNEMAGDGCDACQPEPGFVCRIFGGCYPTICGDGMIDFDWETQTGESCEDGNLFEGDGCDVNCKAEEGWVCRWDGCAQALCGDGVVARGDFGDGEQCDDANLTGGDGCDASCNAEPGWYCDDFLGCQQVICGDLTISPGEMCDDGDAQNGDGCNSICQSEPGWSCGFMPGDCRQVVCGDGVMQGDDVGSVYEACDDANVVAGDGCDASCQLEAGWVCNDRGECHAIVCGDGLVDANGGFVPGPRPRGAKKQPLPIDPIDPGGPGKPPPGGETGSEQCDDANVVAGDGCSETCGIEDGWICDVAGAPCVMPVCSDGKVEGGESCDDGNDLSGDGCTGGCKRESGWVCREPGRACEPMPSAWVCSIYVYGTGDGCDCGCGSTDPDCATPANIGDCTFNHCLEEAPYPLGSDPTQCGIEAPPVEVGPEVVEAVEVVEIEPEAGPVEEDVVEAGPEVVESEPSAPMPADSSCAGGGAGALGMWALGIAGLMVLRRRRAQL